MWLQGCAKVAGVDEAGRGALAGPVVAAVVLLDPGRRTGTATGAARRYPYSDSKVLTAAKRQALAAQVRSEAVAFALGVAEVSEVDALNVLGATKLAVGRALETLAGRFDGLVTDYLRLALATPEVAVAKADALSYQVAAASILAKVERDRMMLELDEVLPGYGFARHKGYGVPEHLRALERLGPSRQHRRSFGPVMRQRLLAVEGG